MPIGSSPPYASGSGSGTGAARGAGAGTGSGSGAGGAGSGSTNSSCWLGVYAPRPPSGAPLRPSGRCRPPWTTGTVTCGCRRPVSSA
ncbi:hypothetical protein E4198_10615 [Streptomyces sp. RKND-216]|nr:hypothetical protein E4198_10615 [Streptomyces sp. RKND-216]